MALQLKGGGEGLETRKCRCRWSEEHFIFFNNHMQTSRIDLLFGKASTSRNRRFHTNCLPDSYAHFSLLPSLEKQITLKRARLSWQVRVKFHGSRSADDRFLQQPVPHSFLPDLGEWLSLPPPSFPPGGEQEEPRAGTRYRPAIVPRSPPAETVTCCIKKPLRVIQLARFSEGGRVCLVLRAGP